MVQPRRRQKGDRISPTPGSAAENQPNEIEGEALESQGGDGQAPTRLPHLSPESRLALMFYCLPLGLLALSHWRMQTSFPEQGIWVAGSFGLVLAIALLMAGMAKRLQALLCWPVALMAALLIWATLSFSWSVAPAEGLETVGTWLEGYWILCIALLAWRAISSPEFRMQGEGRRGEERRGEGRGETRRGETEEELGTRNSELGTPQELAAWALFVFFSVLIVASAFKGLYQYFFGYDAQLAEMGRDVGLNPDRFSEAIMNTLREKRISSWYGNPNVFAYTLAMGLPFLIGLTAAFRRFWPQALATMGFFISLAALFLTKSRGGWLCALLAVALAAIIVGRERWKRLALPGGFAAGLFLICLLLFVWIVPHGARFAATPGGGTKQDAAAAAIPQAQREAGFWKRLTRISTIQERIYYLEAAARQLQFAPLSPLRGNGVGSYAVLYLQTASQGAREARDAHNALMQLWVEAGLPAAGLMLAIYCCGLLPFARGGPCQVRASPCQSVPVRASPCPSAARLLGKAEAGGGEGCGFAQDGRGAVGFVGGGQSCRRVGVSHPTDARKIRLPVGE
ncbi:MAG: O-antigen ligase family protein [Candidatus Sumerlaeota bacterium]|nr:O-antigen ligase family protein [Candidatus Sumerlaeota bacterium]